jgi:hypothetical protein
MAWAKTDCVPAQLNIAAVFGEAFTQINDQTIKVSPLSSSGGVFDMTGLSSLTLSCDGGNPVPGLPTLNVSPAVVVADGTGVSFTLTSPNFANILGALGVTTVRCSLYGTFGTNQLLATGTINFKMAA